MEDPASFVDVSIRATDGYPLAGRLWLAEPALAVAIINAGAGIPMPFYRRFAAFLAANGVATLSYDYRGIGQSRPARLKGFMTSVEEWGSKDCAAALAWAARRYPNIERVVVGHSVGGFLAGFAPNTNLIHRLVLIGAHTGYWGDYSPRARPWMYALWHMFMPAATSVLGYFPGRALHLGDDLPAGVAMDWANRRRGDFWWNLRTATGEPDDARRDALLAGFRRVNADTIALRFSDDPFATARATERLLMLYSGVSGRSVEVTPKDMGESRIGHFGFFRARMARSLWPKLIEWFRLPGKSTLANDRSHAAD